jgi:hypothetical protein
MENGADFGFAFVDAIVASFAGTLAALVVVFCVYRYDRLQRDGVEAPPIKLLTWPTVLLLCAAGWIIIRRTGG